eukprot:496906-Pyramimonas_sp.AAC.1
MPLARCTHSTCPNAFLSFGISASMSALRGPRYFVWVGSLAIANIHFKPVIVSLNAFQTCFGLLLIAWNVFRSSFSVCPSISMSILAPWALAAGAP